MTVSEETGAGVLGRPLALPCGLVLKNRIIKSAMSDSLGDGQGNATPAQARLYVRWAEGGVALSLIGEVQADPRYPEKPGNLVLGPDTDRAALRNLALKGQANTAHLWPQLGHAGALSYAPVSAPKGPSPLDLDGLHCAGFSVEDIEALPAQYARAAKIAVEAGFTGVQIHAGHGFLLSQFLSPLFNHRTDCYGGKIGNRFRLIGMIIDAVREAVGARAAVGIKMNATDQLEGGLTQEDALEVVRLLDQTSVDLIEVSGGTYFPGAPSSSDSTSATGPYFLEFCKAARKATKIPLCVTGGFKTRTQAIAALESGDVDAVGIARGLVVMPDLAAHWVAGNGPDPSFPRFSQTVPGGVTAWYSMRLTALSGDREDHFDFDLSEALQVYDARDQARCHLWNARFQSS